MSALFNQLIRLQNHLKTDDVFSYNIPIGISFSSDGSKVYLKYSLSSPEVFNSLDDALTQIKDYLDEVDKK